MDFKWDPRQKMGESHEVANLIIFLLSDKSSYINGEDINIDGLVEHMEKKVIGLIPTRLGSTRLPQKALLEINNLPLIIHTYRRAKLFSKLLDDVVICCDDKKILNIANKFRAKAIITSPNHKNGTERICEAYQKLNKNMTLL